MENAVSVKQRRAAPPGLAAEGKVRLGYIDALKGFAALYVVLGHVANGYIGADIYSDKSFFHSVYNAVYAFHMPLFIMLSGFLFQNAYFQKMETEGTKKPT